MGTTIATIPAAPAIVGVDGLKTIASATAAWVDVEHDGTSWRLTGYGVL